MAQHDRGAGFGQPHNGPQNTPRLRLKRKSPITGFVDGAWWPHSDDLAAELPDLLAVLSVRLGAVSRVTYKRSEWATAPRKLVVDDQLIRLDGYDRQPASTVGVVDSRGASIVLLVVPAHTDSDHAHAVLMAAAAPDDATTVDMLLTPAAH
ncbi:DUF5994 family protein [Mycobacterium sp. ITM-2016-00317]|uniref:DUF5994 family protein n=1 Tax=Mycobacterium sp. ITM-2016-00317 TaxID=2099694 RepID=UPI00287FB8D2|nr:DUF5994 family protein [Mycobacterium sp. ITM-2016-00317]WNG88471.1 DUF5994 family protein [Mycobacterium sp. ITM-2016-00317]